MDLRAEEERFKHESSSVEHGKDLRSRPKAVVSHWPRKRPKVYAVRRGRNVGIFHSWEECERQTKGVYSEFKSFHSLEEA